MTDGIIKPDQDYMIVKKHDKPSLLHLPKSASMNTPKELIPFEIISIGPGYWEMGVYIKTTHKPGNMVLINGPIIASKFNDEEILIARAKDIAGTII